MNGGLPSRFAATGRPLAFSNGGSTGEAAKFGSGFSPSQCRDGHSFADVVQPGQATQAVADSHQQHAAGQQRRDAPRRAALAFSTS